MSDTEHRVLLQWCLSRQIFSEQQFLTTANQIYHDLERPFDHQTLLQLVDEINSNISEISLALRSHINQHKANHRWWALVNTNADPISLVATPYTAGELGVLRRLIESIVVASRGNFKLAWHDSIRCVVSAEESSLSKTDAEELVNRFCEDGWLRKEQGEVGLSDRALIELQQYLTEEYKDEMRTCGLCKETATCGVVACEACQEEETVYLHPVCFERMRDGGRSQVHCPKCRKRVRDSPKKFGKGNIVMAEEDDDGMEMVSDSEPEEI